MSPKKSSWKNIDEYIAAFPESTQEILKKMRAVIREAAPDAAETINYDIPTFTLHGNLVHFGAFKNHIGFYPAPSGIDAFRKELSIYEGAKGSVKFPIGQPIPYDLVAEIVKFRVIENLNKFRKKPH